MPSRPSDRSRLPRSRFACGGFQRALPRSPICSPLDRTRPPGNRGRCLVLVLLAALCAPVAQAQERDQPPPLPTPRPDSAAVRLPADTLARPLAPTPRRTDDDGLDEPVQFSARDSLVIRFREDGDQGRLVGHASVTSGDVQLDAYAIDILFDQDELHAEGLPTDTGLVGRPTFTTGSETFTGTAFAYNMRTERGRVVGANTSFEDGFIRANVAKVREDSTLFIRNGAYTTCDCGPDETPSYSLRSSKMKVVNQKWIYTGPIQLYIYDIPTPLWLPFGFLPAQEGRRSGILPPEYGEDQRGFYLRNWGYYWAINDYIDLQVRAGIWTKGSYQVNPIFQYNRRYRYNGRISVDYLRERSGERADPDVVIRNTVSLRWNHSQDLNPTSRLTGNVNLVSNTSYLRTVSDQYDDNVRQTIGSSIQYNKRWPEGGRTLSLNLRHNQVLATDNVDLTLPELSFNQSSRTPFRSSTTTGGELAWYERITLSYTGRLNNRYTFRPLPEDSLIARGAEDVTWYEALFNPKQHERATGETLPFDFQATHRIPISAPFDLNRLPLLGAFRLNVSPNLNYNETWYIQTQRRMADSTNRAVVEDVPGFFALRQFNMGASANTTFYGIFPVGVGPYQGVRHTVRPSLGFSYSPDFSSDFWGYTRTYTDTSGTPVEYAIVSGVQTQKQQTLSFNLDNIFETRRVSTDTTGQQQTRTLKLFNVGLSTGYNVAADSLKLQPITLNARTTILGELDLNLGATFSPYALNAAGTGVVNRYLFSLRDLRFARMTRFNLSGDFALRGGQQGPSRPSLTDRQQQQNQFVNPNAAAYLGQRDPFGDAPYTTTDEDGLADFAIPWSLGVRFTYSLSRPLDDLRRTFAVNTTFDFNLTPNWKVRGRSGYDFERKELVTTELNILRDFECWEMSIRWVPFGQFQSWGFDLHVKSGKLRDILRIRQPRSERDRFSI